jgi:tRNA nucleotidyltransferase (CCA-adding enzyme)
LVKGGEDMRYNFDAPFEMLDKINAEGFEAYFVGGAVRDFIMDKAFQDIDITTSAHPDEIKRIFSDCNVIDTGIKHGTVTVMYNNRPIEITTFRTELGYEDNRHPDKVVFCKNRL